MRRPASPLHILILCLGVAVVTGSCSDPINRSTEVQTPAGPSLDKRVESIQAQSQRVDDLDEAPAPNYRRLEFVAQNWQFSGLFENANPVLLLATLMEGGVVREEKYYLVEGKVVRVKTEKWWDVDDPGKAPEPRIQQDFYIDNGRTIRQITEVDSAPPSKRTDDTESPAVALIDRSTRIARILSEKVQDPSVLGSLQDFP